LLEEGLQSLWNRGEKEKEDEKEKEQEREQDGEQDGEARHAGG
jgi:hypothetical protein